MRFSPRPYQQTAIDRMVDRPYQLLALRMGAGKTVCALSAIQRMRTRTLIVAPKRVAELVWHNEAQKWEHTKGLRVERVIGSPTEREKALARDADVYVINRENFVWLVDRLHNAWPFKCVVIDENRGFKDRASQSWKALKKVRPQIRKLFILTGTPTPNSLLELWPQISILDQGKRLGTGITKYRDRWFVPGRRNGMVIYDWVPKPGAAEEIYALVADVMLSVESDIDLPERMDNIVRVSMPRAAWNRYEELTEELVSGDVVAANAAVLAGKLGQMANGAVYDNDGEVQHIHDGKLDALQEIVDQGEPVLCFTAYRHDQDRIKKRFPQAVLFDGERSLREWQAGRVPLLLMHPASGGHGVDGLQVGGRVAVWFGLPFSLELYEQANARLHRSGQTRGVVVHHLVADGTIDERIMDVLASKGDMQEALLRAVKELTK
jgi:SNF2 family DNA or RNA helicase